MENEDVVSTGRINIIPNYVTKSAYNYNEHSSVVTPNCLCNGRYCASHNLEDGFLKTTNEDVLVESIRQKCIYKIANQKTDIKSDQHMLYLNYMRDFYNTCIVNKQYSLSCSRNILTKYDSKLNGLVEECFIKSFTYPNNASSQDQYLTCQKNEILENDSAGIDMKLKNSMPIIYVNDNSFYGSYTYENVFEAMCADIKDKPSSCYSKYSEVFKKEEGFQYTTYIVVAILFLVFNIIAVIFWRRYMNNKVGNRVTSKDINDKINDIVSAYVALKERK
jgi:hypothetical protein